MRVHHLNCGSMRTVPPVDESTSPERIVCHCLLVETDADGLVLVETGIGLGDLEHPRESLGADFLAFAEPVLDAGETAVRQVAGLGFSPADVRHVVLTHLHRDHGGGLPDFPDAVVHLHEAEYRAATDPGDAYHAYGVEHFPEPQRAHGPRWAPARPDGSWFGLPAAGLEGLPDDILLIPLAGHTPGHSGVAVRVADRWLLHAGDAYFYQGEIEADPPVSHPLLDLVQENAQADRNLRLETLQRLRTLHREHGDRVEIFSAHDPWVFRRYAPHV
jgi:glyoxylase-like metal-dependent hydrolase (beta-lactamase superfamily II)